METYSLKNKKRNKIPSIMMVLILILALFSTSFLIQNKPVNAHPPCAPPCPCAVSCKEPIINCAQSACVCQSNADTPVTIKHITTEFIKHREWIIKILWEAHVLPAMMLMTEQISAAAMQQVQIIGSFFDAKHQLETQRLLQDLQAQAHKDYQPSEGMCHFATNTRSLAASSQNTNLAQAGISSWFTQRQLMSGDGISAGGSRSDSRARLNQFRKTYCNPAGFGNGLDLLCDSDDIKRYDKDVNFAQTVGNAQTLKIDFKKTSPTADKEDVLALSANLYGHKLLSRIDPDKMVKNGSLIPSGALAYMKTRALTTKRSVAQSAFAAQTAMKAQGEKKVRPYMIALLKEMGIQEAEIEKMVGDRPSYFAQMELLTKKLYQTPNFYAALYDKPTNVDRKNVSMQALALMQRRDMYRSQLRSEAMMAVWLETSLEASENLSVNEVNAATETRILDLPLD